MNDIDEIRSALSDATRLSGEMYARPTAAVHIRSEAIRRRQRTRAAGAVALSGCVALVAAVFASGVFTGQGTATQLPASGPSASASANPESRPEISIAPGPHTFSSPVEIHRVAQAFSGAECPTDVKTVPAVDGGECFQLGPSSLVIRDVRELQSGLKTNEQGMASTTGGVLNLSMNQADTEAFYTLTSEAAASAKDRFAVVVNGEVYNAPTTVPIPTGQLEIVLGNEDLPAFLAELGVEYSVR